MGTPAISFTDSSPLQVSYLISLYKSELSKKKGIQYHGQQLKMVLEDLKAVVLFR